MFTGIVEKSVRVVAATPGPKFLRLVLATSYDDVKPGESIAVNGVCLTAAELGPAGEIGFDVVKETLDKTNLGLLGPGDEAHVERALRAGDRIDGHFVQGHVDGTGPLVKQVADAQEWRLTIEAPHHLAKYLVPKGSVAVDGVSLTIAKVEGNSFEVALIPTTVQVTRLARKDLRWPFNLECDVLSKTIVHYLEARGL